MNYVPEMRLRVVKEDMVFFGLCLVAGSALLAMLALIIYLGFAWSVWTFLGLIPWVGFVFLGMIECPQVRV